MDHTHVLVFSTFTSTLLEYTLMQPALVAAEGSRQPRLAGRLPHFRSFSPIPCLPNHPTLAPLRSPWPEAVVRAVPWPS